MKPRYILLVGVAVLSCLALPRNGNLKAQSETAVKVAVLPFKALGEDNATRQVALNLRNALMKKAQNFPSVELVAVNSLGEAPKNARLAVEAEVSVQGEMVIVGFRLLDMSAGGKEIARENIPGSSGKPAFVVNRMFDIVRKYANPSPPPPSPGPTTAPTITGPATPELPPQPHPPPPPPAVAPPRNNAPPSRAPVRVKTRGVGVAHISKQRLGEYKAKRSALILAQRDAIERALGTIIDLVAAPAEQRRKIIASMQGKIRKVRVVYGERRGDYFIYQITAEVIIPPELRKKFPPPPPPESTGLPPALQPFPKGHINWGDGYLVATGTGKIEKGKPNAAQMAERAAKMDAYGVAMEMMAAMNFSPDLTMGEVLKKEKMREYRIRGLVQGAETIRTEKSDSEYKITTKVPLWGLRGITVVFSDIYNLLPSPPVTREKGLEKKPEGRPFTGLLIDARGTGLAPALFPIIEDEGGGIVYGAGMITPEALSRRGAAAYATSKKGSQGARLGPNPLRIRAKSAAMMNEGMQVAALGPWAWRCLSARLLLPFPWIIVQATAKAKVTIRQGNNPLKVKSTKATGTRKAKIVITRKTAELIRKTDRQSNYLKEARVVVIIDSMVGATEGRTMPREDGELASNWIRPFR